MLIDTVRGIVWSLYLKSRGAKIGKNLRVRGSVDILLRDGASLVNLIISDNVTISGNVYIRMRKQGRIFLGLNVGIGVEVWLVTANESELRVGDNTGLGSYCIFNGGHGISIGRDCMIASFAYINSSDHGHDRNSLMREQPYNGSAIVIGNDVWLGGHVTVTQGVTLGDGVVIGANAVVTRDIPPYAIAVGSPAKVLKYRE